MRRTFWMRRLGLLALVAGYVATYAALTGWPFWLAVAIPLVILGYLGLTARPRTGRRARDKPQLADASIHFDWPRRP